MGLTVIFENFGSLISHSPFLEHGDRNTGIYILTLFISPTVYSIPSLFLPPPPFFLLFTLLESREVHIFPFPLPLDKHKLCAMAVRCPVNLSYFNCRGFNASEKQNQILYNFRKMRSNILLLQETQAPYRSCAIATIPLGFTVLTHNLNLKVFRSPSINPSPPRYLIPSSMKLVVIYFLN